jgi:hypothetical protein
VPKSSMATRTPIAFKSSSVITVDSASCINTVSVSSSSRSRGSIPVAINADRTPDRQSLDWNSTADTFTEIGTTPSPESLHSRACLRASNNTHSPMRRIKPHSSAIVAGQPSSSCVFHVQPSKHCYDQNHRAGEHNKLWI